MSITIDIYRECEIVKQDLTRAIALLSKLQTDNVTASVNVGEEDIGAGELSQDEIIQRLKPLRLTVVAKECDLAYSTVLRMSRGGIIHRKSLKVVSDYIIKQGKG